MVSLRIFLNLDETQPQVFRARTKAALLAKVERFIVDRQADVCMQFSDTPDREAKYLLTYSEGYKEWEYRDWQSDVDCESGDLEKMAHDFLHPDGMAASFITGNEE